MHQNSSHIEGCRAAGALGALLAMLLCFAAAKAEGTNLGYGMGGRFSDYDGTVDQYNISGDRFRIRGRCQSACTLFLSIKNVCIERSAVLGFHAGTSGIATAHMMNAYNARLRNYLNAGNYMGSRIFHTISGSDMIARFGYKACPSK